MRHGLCLNQCLSSHNTTCLGMNRQQHKATLTQNVPKLSPHKQHNKALLATHGIPCRLERDVNKSTAQPTRAQWLRGSRIDTDNWPCCDHLSTMLSPLAKLLLFGALSSNAVAQFIPEPTDLKKAIGHAGIPVRYKQVPTGICELNPKVKSFSGYADVEENEHVFFWFFESRDVDPHKAPLTVWINGGPGSSSMIGLFQELGPCGVDYYGKVYDNPYSFSKVSNMLFIDQPTTVGFSYSKAVDGYYDRKGKFVPITNNTCPPEANGTCGTYSDPNTHIIANSTETAAPGMWKTLQGFMGAFPQYSNNGFHFATESYGGHYGPVFNEYFEKQNRANIPGAKKIDLKSVMIGNGW